MEHLLEFAQAVFEKTRLRLVKVLLDRELCVCEIAEVFGLSQPRASQHLRILRRAGVVDERREGKWVFYKANSKAFEDFDSGWREYVRARLEEITQLADVISALQSERLKSVRENCAGINGD